MSVRVDSRDVVERAMDAFTAAEWDLTHAEPAARCECGATLLVRGGFEPGFVCAGCGLVPTYQLHPGVSIPNAGERGRGGQSLLGGAVRFARSFLIGWRS